MDELAEALPSLSVYLAGTCQDGQFSRLASSEGVLMPPPSQTTVSVATPLYRKIKYGNLKWEMCRQPVYRTPLHSQRIDDAVDEEETA